MTRDKNEMFLFIYISIKKIDVYIIIKNDTDTESHTD